MRLLATLLILTLPGWPVAAAAQERVTAFVGGTVIDGTGTQPIPEAAILIAGERIVAVGPAAETEIPDGATVIDAGGTWIIPGLIDAHVHFFQSGGLYTRPDVIDLRAVRPYEEELARIFYRFGEEQLTLFILNASPRQEADPFFTVHYDPAQYTEARHAWIEPPAGSV
jgi:predicted amidohydrolase YtcJ